MEDQSEPRPDAASPSGPTGPSRPPTGFDLISMGVTTALMLVSGMGLGWLLGSWLGFNPGGIFLGLFFGLFCAVVSGVRSIRKFF